MPKILITAALLWLAGIGVWTAYDISHGHPPSREWLAFWPAMAAAEALILAFSSFLSWLEKRK